MFERDRASQDASMGSPQDADRPVGKQSLVEQTFGSPSGGRAMTTGGLVAGPTPSGGGGDRKRPRDAGDVGGRDEDTSGSRRGPGGPGPGGASGSAGGGN